MSTVASATLEDYFPFMQLPPELRQQIYKNLLVTSCCQPGVPIQHPYAYYPTDYPLRDEAPAVQILQVSKAIKNEATSILYAWNTITTATLRGCDDYYDTVLFRYLDDFRSSSDKKSLAKTGERNYLKAFWTRAKRTLARDVSMIFDPDPKQPQTWLCLRPVWAWFNKHEWSVPSITGLSAGRILDLSEDLGSHLPTFLRRVGKVNAATIRRVKLQFPDAVRCAVYFPIYAEILRQHVPRLCRLSIDIRNIECFGENLGWDELYLHYEENKEQLTDHVVVALFDEMRQLLNDLPDLKVLKFSSSCDAFDNLATAIMEEKRAGKSFNIQDKWWELKPVPFNISRCSHLFH